ncbi:MAG: tRNA (guanine37-N1)-methyltransferase [Oceanicoccus sp.]|jgi:tRNA (guanine37-N1)-methyltransferase
MRFDVLTLFPDLILPYFQDSIMKRAIDEGQIELHVHNIRDYSTDKHRKVDDTPYGGGAGMLMTCQPLFDAIEAVKKDNSGPVVYFTPQGERFSQERAESLSELGGMILICGRYEGIDYRVREALVDIELSIGDYVLTGGELAATVVMDAVTRLLPDVLGDNDSAHMDSFSPGLDRKKEHPHYTKPAEFKGMKVPEVLMNGDHGKIKQWREDHLQ